MLLASSGYNDLATTKTIPVGLDFRPAFDGWNSVAGRILVNGITDNKGLVPSRLSEMRGQRTEVREAENKPAGTDRGNRANMSVLLLLMILVEAIKERRIWGAWSSPAEAFAR